MGYLKKAGKSLLLFALVITISLSWETPASTSYAASGWWLDPSAGNRDDTIYGGSSTEDADDSGTEEEVGFVEATLSHLIYAVGWGLSKLLAPSGEGAEVSFSIDTIVLGRLAEDVDVSYIQFDLNDGNPFGIIGAYAYVIVRRVVYSVFLLYTIWILIGHMVHARGSKGRAELKTDLQNMVFFFAMIYAVPFVTQALLYVKDVGMYLLNNALSNGSSVVSIMDHYKDAYATRHSFLNAILYCATVGAGLNFASNYLGTALTQMALLGASPYICVKSIKDKKIYSQWASTFFINIFIPLVDLLLLMVPTLMETIATKNGDNGGTFMILELFLIWAVIPSRTGILRALGSVSGGGVPGGGMAGLAMAAGMMARTAARGAKSIGKSGGNGSGSSGTSAKEDKAEAAVLENSQQEIDKAAMGAGHDIKDINEIMGEGNSGNSGSGSGMDNEGIGTSDSMGTPGSMGDTDAPASAPVGNGSGSSDNSSIGAGIQGSEIGAAAGSGSGASGIGSGASGYSQLPDEIADGTGNASIAQDRYQNLQSMDAHLGAMDKNNQEIISNDRQIADIDSQIVGKDAEIAQNAIDRREAFSDRGAAQAQMAEIKNAGGNDLENNPEYQAASEKFNAAGSKMQECDTKATRLQAEKTELEAKKGQLNDANTVLKDSNKDLQAGLNDAKNREQEYANLDKMGGGSGQQYNSAASYKAGQVVAQNQSSLANYKNFDSGKFDGALTPQERADFLRERAAHKQKEKIVQFASKAGGVAAGVAVGAGMAYGGPSLTAVGAMGGYAMGSGAVSSGYSAGQKAVSIAKEDAETGHIRSVNGKPLSRGTASGYTGGRDRVPPPRMPQKGEISNSAKAAVAAARQRAAAAGQRVAGAPNAARAGVENIYNRTFNRQGKSSTAEQPSNPEARNGARRDDMDRQFRNNLNK